MLVEYVYTIVTRSAFGETVQQLDAVMNTLDAHETSGWWEIQERRGFARREGGHKNLLEPL